MSSTPPTPPAAIRTTRGTSRRRGFGRFPAPRPRRLRPAAVRYGQPPPGYGQPPGYGPQPFGQPPYGPYGSGQIEHPQGTTILVMGILGIVFCPILAPAAWVMGNTALREIDAQPGRYSNRGVVQAGRLCGMIYSIFLVLMVVGAFVLIALAGVSVSASSS